MEKPWLKDFEEDLAKWRPLWEKHGYFSVRAASVQV